MTDSKVWWQSKVIWVNALTIASVTVMFLTATQAQGGLPFSIDPRWLTIALGIINIALRFVTNQPVTGSKP